MENHAEKVLIPGKSVKAVKAVTRIIFILYSVNAKLILACHETMEAESI